jgi:hypothetical protein
MCSSKHVLHITDHQSENFVFIISLWKCDYILQNLIFCYSQLRKSSETKVWKKISHTLQETVKTVLKHVANTVVLMKLYKWWHMFLCTWEEKRKMKGKNKQEEINKQKYVNQSAEALLLPNVCLVNYIRDGCFLYRIYHHKVLVLLLILMFVNISRTKKKKHWHLMCVPT